MKQHQTLADFDFILQVDSAVCHQLIPVLSNYWIVSSLISPQKRVVLIKLRDSQQASTKLLEQAKLLRILKKKKKKSLKNYQNVNELQVFIKNQQNPTFKKLLLFYRSRLEDPLIKEQEELSVFDPNKSDQFFFKDKLIFTQWELLKMKYQILVQNPLIEQLLVENRLNIIPCPTDSQSMVSENEQIQQKLGQQVSSYFKFLQSLQQMLKIPMVLGVLTLIGNYLFAYDQTNSPFDPLYGFSILIISGSFYCQVVRDQNWDFQSFRTGQNQKWTELQGMISTVHFSQRLSKITGLPQHFIPLALRIKLICISVLKLAPILLLTLVFLLFSLNLRGFVDDRYKLIHIPLLANLATEDSIFDKKSWWALIPGILHSAVLNLIDQKMWRPASRQTSRNEGYLTRKQYQKSIIYKFFFYEFVISFVDMFYLAFVCWDIRALKGQFVTLFIIDIFRRFIFELVIPLVSKKVSGWMHPESAYSLQKELSLYVDLPSYDSFDDYLQIVINYGYLIMLSSAPILIYLAHQVEKRHDAVKVFKVYRRPEPKVFNGIGHWKTILLLLSVFSIFTNIALFAFSSDQIVKFLPWAFEKGSQLLQGEVQDALNTFMEPTLLHAQISKGKQKAVLGLVWLLEHLAVGIFLTVMWISSKRKGDPSTILRQRRNYKRVLKSKLKKGD